MKNQTTMLARSGSALKRVVHPVCVMLIGGIVIVATAGPVAAHGVGGRTDLPLPTWLVTGAAVFVLAISFAAVGAVWRQPSLRAAAVGKVLPSSVQKLSRLLVIPGKVVGLALFALVLFAALRGNTNPSVNIAPAAVYIVFWVGLPVVSMLVGDAWRAFNPIHLLASAADRVSVAIGRDAAPGRYRQDQPHHWWAAMALFGFAWLELAYFDSASPRAIAVFLVSYTAAMLIGAALLGLDWARHADGFGVLFGFIGAIGPLGREHDGQLRLRWPLAGLAAMPVLPGTTGLILVVLGATSFDGFTRSSVWLDVISNQSGWNLTIINTLGLVFVIAVVFVIYRAAIAVMSMITGDREQELSDFFVLSLVPIAVAYIVAHYFSLVVFEGQSLIAHISDPFGRGWDLFGTATRQIDYTLISTDTIAWVQTAAIVVGHILAVMVAHDRAVERYQHPMAIRSQYPMLVAMIAYTIIGLLLLSG